MNELNGDPRGLGAKTTSHETKIILAPEIKFNAGATDVSVDAGGAFFEGYGSVFHVVDNVHDMILPGAFAQSLGRWKEKNAWPPLLWQHDMKEPIGLWHEMFEDEKGLFVRGELFVNHIPRAKEAQKLLQEKVVTGLSIGYRTLQSYEDRAAGVRVLTEVDLVEVSLVTFPANEWARVSNNTNAIETVADQGEELKLFHESILKATEEWERAIDPDPNPEAAAAAALLHSLREATAQMEAAIYRMKFDESQPRAPRGTSDGGQWVEDGRPDSRGPGGENNNAGLGRENNNRGLGGVNNRVLLPQRRPATATPQSPKDPDAIRPVYPVETALAILTGAEVGAVAARVAARAAGRAVQYVGARIARYQSEARIERAAKAIEEHLGDHAPVIRNQHGDHVFMNKAGDKKVRFDINKTGFDKNGKPIKPHFQIEKLKKNGKWKDAGLKHHYYFKQ